MIKFLDHNAALLFSIVWAIAAIFMFYGCQSTTNSLLNPGQRITAEQLDAEVTSFNAKAKAAYSDIERQEVFKKTLSEHFAIIAQEGTINTTGVINLALGILGLGSILTFRKKNSTIKTLKNNGRTPNQTPTSSS